MSLKKTQLICPNSTAVHSSLKVSAQDTGKSQSKRLDRFYTRSLKTTQPYLRHLWCYLRNQAKILWFPKRLILSDDKELQMRWKLTKSRRFLSQAEFLKLIKKTILGAPYKWKRPNWENHLSSEEPCHEKKWGKQVLGSFYLGCNTQLRLSQLIIKSWSRNTRKNQNPRVMFNHTRTSKLIKPKLLKNQR